MKPIPRGSALIIAVVAMLIVAVIGVGLLRFTQRSVAFSIGGPRHKALVTCADAARALLESRFHVLGKDPTEIAVLNERLDGPQGRMRALGGHVDADPSQPLVVIKQVELLPANAVSGVDASSGDITNVIGGINAGGGRPLKVTVHCQEGDTSSPTSGRQMEIEYGIRFGL
jgi:Tfp pilus assembly protein PilX